MTVLAIDPGHELSAWVMYDGERPVAHAIEPNERMHQRLCEALPTARRIQAVVIERVESMGMAVGYEVFETVHWAGRFFECAFGVRPVHRLTRHEVKLHLCHSRRAKDAEVRMALLNRFGPTKAKAIGTAKARGPLFGIKSHEWAALAVAVAWWDRHSPHAIKAGEAVR